MGMDVSAWRVLPTNQGVPLLRLNLGCGLRRLGGFLNIDSDPGCSPDLVRDLTRGLPFADNSAAEIQCSDVLEHLVTPEDVIFVLNEAHRVLAPGRAAVFRTPNALSKAHPEWALGDPTHRQLWTVHRWAYFEAGHEQHEVNGRRLGILPWRIQIVLLEGDGIIQAICQPVKGD